jgi:hypothetical protein
MPSAACLKPPPLPPYPIRSEARSPHTRHHRAEPAEPCWPVVTASPHAFVYTGAMPRHQEFMPYYRSPPAIAFLAPLTPHSVTGKSCVAPPYCRRPIRASVPPLPSLGKHIVTAPPSSFELVSCHRLATSALLSHQVELRCSTKSAASSHVSCTVVLVEQGCPRPQHHRRATSFSPTVSHRRTSSSSSSCAQSDPLLLVTAGPSRAGAPLVATIVYHRRSTRVTSTPRTAALQAQEPPRHHPDGAARFLQAQQVTRQHVQGVRQIAQAAPHS